MKRLSKKCILEGYSGLKSAHVIESKTPVIRCPREVLVKVQSSSLNPLDKRMADGYGSNVLESLRIAQSGLVGSGSSSFPLVLGRDVSGTVVDSGGDAKSGF
ncbi:reticulon-4-interacting protein 1 homolog, mitochondrial isoform X2 [Eurytemora carolleeae]|nr:reticulon-4-interacting protein 1 homolog, mitochondrial isoform X2 [Eurytemora carolleeae]|eukprot:XP_023348135.1 reticulon-4-interacting protein 1 homolog, mitochondrial-like isoform X2 [Eurytemora affinis]